MKQTGGQLGLDDENMGHFVILQAATGQYKIRTPSERVTGRVAFVDLTQTGGWALALIADVRQHVTR